MDRCRRESIRLSRITRRHILSEVERMACKSFEPGRLISTVALAFSLIFGVAFSAPTQGICVADVIAVRSVAGKVVAQFDGGEAPVTEASVSLRRGTSFGPVIARQPAKTDGSFGFGHIKPGRYVLVVAAPGFTNFYLGLDLVGSRAKLGEKEIFVLMGVDFKKHCSGSTAELRDKKKSDSAQRQ
jgi:hypothetical protein